MRKLTTDWLKTTCQGKLLLNQCNFWMTLLSFCHLPLNSHKTGHLVLLSSNMVYLYSGFLVYLFFSLLLCILFYSLIPIENGTLLSIIFSNWLLLVCRKIVDFSILFLCCLTIPLVSSVSFSGNCLGLLK